MKKLYINRFSDDGVQTLGKMFIQDGDIKLFECCTLELPWKGNQKKISCIPVGEYDVVKRVTESHGHHFHITHVPSRDFILIHSANYVNELLGCVAPGSAHQDINKDGRKDVINSKATMAKLWDNLPSEFKLKIS